MIWAEKVSNFKKRLRRGNLFFLGLLAALGLWMLFLAVTQRTVRGHDGFEYFSLQYYFLNNAVMTGEIPHWMPYLVHGCVSDFWYGLQAGLFQSTLFLAAPLLKGFSFLCLFYLGTWLDQALLLAGVWLLGGIYYRSVYARFFTALTVIGSAVWFDQPGFNFHFYYSLPLILYFFHRLLETARWRYFALGGNLIALHPLGSPPYLVPVVTFCVFIYFVFWAAFYPRRFLEALKKLKPRPAAAAAVLFVAASVLLTYVFLKTGWNGVISYNEGRGPEHVTSIRDFLSYAGNLKPSKWIELVLGVSPFLDLTLYGGMALAAFGAMGIFFSVRYRRDPQLAAVFAVLFLFSVGHPVAVLIYETWPMMKYYRHLALVSPLAKLFLCFLAGIGFEEVFFGSRKSKETVKLILALALAGLAFLIFDFSRKPEDQIGNFFFQMVTKGKSGHAGLWFSRGLDGVMAASRLRLNALIAALLAVFFLWALFSGRKRTVVMGLILLLHGGDLLIYQFSNTLLKTYPLRDPASVSILRFQPLVFNPRRVRSRTSADPGFNIYSNDSVLRNAVPRSQALHDWYYSYGSQHLSNNAFLFLDELGCSWRVDYWLEPFDKYIRAYRGQPLGDKTLRPTGLVSDVKFVFPDKPPALKISALTEDKIQFFLGASEAVSDEEAASLMTDPAYGGDEIFLTAPAGMKRDWGLPPAADRRKALGEDRRIRLPYRVTRFDSNHLTVETDTQGQDGFWMLYSDVWHPDWKAEVNGRPVSVWVANLAYKAVRLDPGKNTVRFRFESGRMTWLTRFFSLNALFWVGAILILCGRIALRRPEETEIGVR